MSIETPELGLCLYNLTLRYPSGPCEPNRKADEKGYYFKDGIVGVLLALMSLFFRCRFYLISSRSVPENPRQGMPIKTEYPFLRIKCNPAIHPPVFQGANTKLATGLAEFLDLVKTIHEKLHQKFILACHHYARALKEIGVDSEMAFIRLVSAIEALSKDHPLTHADDALEEQGVSDLIAQSGLSKEFRSELKSVFDVRKITKEVHSLYRAVLQRFFQRWQLQSPAFKD
jgi:hypothetical protein